jgi:hypothetical protein
VNLAPIPESDGKIPLGEHRYALGHSFESSFVKGLQQFICFSEPVKKDLYFLPSEKFGLFFRFY